MAFGEILSVVLFSTTVTAITRRGFTGHMVLLLLYYKLYMILSKRPLQKQQTDDVDDSKWLSLKKYSVLVCFSVVGYSMKSYHEARHRVTAKTYGRKPGGMLTDGLLTDLCFASVVLQPRTTYLRIVLPIVG